MTNTITVQSPEFYALPVFIVSFLSVAMTLIWALIYGRGDRSRTVKLVLCAAAVLVVSAAAARSGALARFDRTPPPMVFLMVLVLAGSVGLGLSRFGRDAAANLSFAALVGLQVFRFPLEQAMHLAAGRGILPVELSYGGYNFDILTGFSAILLLGALKRGRAPRLAVWIWNVWGIACLAAIVVMAILTSPMVRAFGDDPRHVNTWVLFPPYIWVLTVLVPIAISGHVILTRKLLQRGQ